MVRAPRPSSPSPVRRVAVPESLAERVCLALVATSPESVHGWALVRLLQPDGEIGRVWSLSRPLTYRAIDQLTAAELVRPVAQVPGSGAARALVTATASGQRAGAAWLVAPVEHLRDVRTELLVKLAVVERAGRDPRALLEAQRATFAPLVAALDGREPLDVVGRWRRTQARATASFLDEAMEAAAGHDRAPDE